MTTSELGKRGFTLKDYADTLRAYRAAGYAVTSFQEYLRDPQSKHLILRHDIDNSIEQAMRVAQVDIDAGCTASVFLRVHARGYNLMSLPSLSIVRAMETMGHEVQLHLEGGFGQVFEGDNFLWAERQRSVFEAAVGRPLGGFSLHEPARLGGFEFATELLGRWSETVSYHAYEPRFMMPQMKYLSDSSGNWREGHFAEWLDKVSVLQVLTHPFWWFDTVPAENY